MQSEKVGLVGLLTLLSLVSMSLSCGVPAPFPTLRVLAQAQDSRKASADQLFGQGSQQYQKGQLEAAIQSWQQALSIYQQLEDRKHEAMVLRNLGATYIAMENYSKAIEFLQLFLPLAKATGDRQGEAQGLGNLGIAYKELGDYDNAIASHQKALALMRDIKHRQGEGQVLGNLGDAYEALGKYDNATESYQQSLAIARDINDRFGEGVVLGNLGKIYANQGEYDKAIESYKLSLVIKQAVGDKQGEASTLNNLGIAHQAQGDLTQAIAYYQKSLSIARAIGERQREGEVLINIGLVYEDQRDFAQAIEHQQQTLKIAQSIGDRRMEGLALNNLGHALFGSGNLVEAEKKLRSAVTVLESLRPGLADAENVSVFDTQVLTYNLLQQILLAQNKSEAALEIAERGRARAFVELLANRMSPQAALKSTVNSEPPTIEQIKQIAKSQNATLVEYSIVPDDEFKFQGKLRGTASELLIWVIQPTGKVAFRRVDLKFLRQQRQTQDKASTSLEDLVSLSRIFDGPRARRGEAARRQLHQLLIEPITQLLPSVADARVIFIPQESLFLLPFPALQDASGQYLVEKHTLLTAPAIQVLDLTRQQRQNQATNYTAHLQGKDVLVVGNPTMPRLKDGEKFEQLASLPGAEQEAVAIAKLLNTKAVIGDEATKVKIVQQMPKARLIHLATHGLLDDIKQLGVPGAIALAPSQNDDGFLTTGEIFDLRLNAELVVLSGCHTGEGEITGDGVVGLSRSIISAGVPSAIVSLWAVPDASTALLMSEFYHNFSSNPDKAKALRSAMLTTMKQYPNPINWAAFTLIGESE
ncbi:MAG TPA: CHAT domain-containing protein [Coleofasciculaceae cyanobacterium]|jgi:CHAT domain-containing protein/Flp pilus assembly protein TadD